MNSLTDKQTAITYEESVDQWTLDAVVSGVEGFWELVACLPGVYPSIARESVRRLAAKGHVPQSFLPGTPPRSFAGLRHGATKGKISRPPQHPLAYDWRFSNSSAVKLMDLVLDLAKEPKTVALLGTPTLYLLASERGFPGSFLLVDRNPRLKAYLPQRSPRSVIETLDIINGEPPARGTFQVVVADPPWYENETKSFLWVATRMCELDGHILLSFPSIGARPGVSDDWNRLLESLPGFGLELVCVEESALSYLTPPFEHNALRAEGFGGIAPDWRRGDLAVLVKKRETTVNRPTVESEQQYWCEFIIDGISLWVRRDSSADFQNPTLLSLVPGDILPTVSRRDTRRKAVQMWTAGNRVFGCKGSNVLARILHAMAVGDEAQTVVGQAIGRGLARQEQLLVSKVTEHIREILETESQERGNHDDEF